MKELFQPLAVCFFLGLAPFYPEPHLLGKLRWVAGGAVGMAPMDWGDLLWHAWPFFWLGWALVRAARKPAPAR